MYELINVDENQLLIADEYFFSPQNSTANVDQKAVEALAIELMSTEPVLAAKAQVEQRWKTIAGKDWPEEVWSRFDQFMDEWMFHYCLVAANSDPNYPRVTGHLYGPPHEWMGIKVPGSRGCFGDGPDQNYGFIPMDVYGRYEITGQIVKPSVSDFIVTLMGNVSMTMSMGNIALENLNINSDGSFTITVDSDPANGRKNHLQSELGVAFLFTRDCRADWRQCPMALRVKRLNEPLALPRNKEQIAVSAAQWMVFDIPANYWFLSIYRAMQVNEVPPPFDTGAIGGLPGQAMLFASLDIAEDEAFILNIGEAGAEFTNVVMFDHLYMTFDYWNDTSTMNTSQGAENEDGSKTYVISHSDPGVQNWLNTNGKQHILIVARWQRVPDPTVCPERPWANGQLVNLSDLNSALPASIKRVTAQERAAQISERQETFKLRYIDA